MRPPFASIVCFLIVINLSASANEIPATNQHYGNVDLQFSVDIPDHLLGCVSEDTNHGVEIFLDGRSGCDGGYELRPRAAVFAEYNVASDAVTPRGLARVDCGYQPSQRTVWLSGWKLGGRDAAGCRQYFKDGRITEEITTIRKTEPNNPEIWIDIAAYLSTTAARYDRDMRTFRQIVRTVRIAPDGPLK
jgi:hypothetical protein